MVRNCRDTERVKLSRNIRKDAEALDGELICLHLNTIVEESGVENLIRALPEIKNHVKVVLLGYFFPNTYQQKIQNLISEMGVDDRVCILEPVSASELISYITDADLGVITRRILNINMKVSLPNRVFEMVAAGLPMAVCKISDISSTVKRGNVGLVFDEENVCDITNTINTLVKKENLKTYKRNALKNRQKLNWQNESQFLCSVVEHLASEKMNVLIIFSSRIYPNRRTIMDHLHCFRRYSNCNVFHLNVATTNFNYYFRWLKWDVVIFHNTFLIRRQSPKDFSDLCNNVSFTKELKCQKFAIAQDEHNHTEVLKKFYKDFEITKVFTVCPNDEQIVKIYGNSITKQIQFVRVLTGYADESLETLIRQYKPKKEREIVIGYRSFKARARLGKLGVMKWLIAEKFQEKLGKYDNLKFDISCDLKDNLSGDDWVKFLLSCKYQLGVEGGSSLHDPGGGIASNAQNLNQNILKPHLKKSRNTASPVRMVKFTTL